MAADFLDTLFSANASAMKILRTVTGSWDRAGDFQGDYVQTIPHDYGNDNIFILGWSKVTNNLNSEVFVFGMPYLDALGDNLVVATWDTSNIYIENPWDGSIGGSPSAITTFEYTILICIV